jgi:hypothetical protein
VGLRETSRAEAYHHALTQVCISASCLASCPQCPLALTPPSRPRAGQAVEVGAGQHSSTAVEGPGAYHVVLEGVDISYDVGADGVVTVQGAVLSARVATRKG